ncbi:hypothetical protein MIS46_09815 [Wielerella bovis]|uniref:hypothetical protein n=1 Tax=Wielerella bovis TaxID=2917790 RepID=UPI0020189ABE|nr:hypothetical protein [Wielerella bovis]ULJ62245.1 hypothetical protein MIS46_09815 [Wielerella bovis]
MKKQITLLGIIILLSSGCTTKNKVQMLPDAHIGQPYSVTIDFRDRISPDSFKASISPENSGLSVSSVAGPYNNETTIAGIPNVKQDISIKIRYFVPAAKGFFVDNRDRENNYLIKVKE